MSSHNAIFILHVIKEGTNAFAVGRCDFVEYKTPFFFPFLPSHELNDEPGSRDNHIKNLIKYNLVKVEVLSMNRSFI